MPKLTTAAWIAHDLGLAAAIGGTLFGRMALDPAVRRIREPADREEVHHDAWSRYSTLSLASHAAIAAPWLVGRVLRSGREVSATARSLTRAKDVLVGVSLASAAASAILGGVVGRRRRDRDGRSEGARAERAHDGEERSRVGIERALDAAGVVNLAANIGMAGVTTALAMEGSQSMRFALSSRKLP